MRVKINKTLQVRLKTAMADERAVYKAGDTIELEEGLARRLIASEQAEAVEPETATASPAKETTAKKG